jgi:hypothetical protein
MKENKSKINCPEFQKQEPAIEDVTAKINEAKNILEKAKFAEELQKEVDVILSCLDYDEKSSDCKNCRFIGNVRKKTADIIIKAKKLA